MKKCNLTLLNIVSKFHQYIYHTIFYISSNCYGCYQIHSDLEHTFPLITIFVQLRSNDVC